MSTTTTTCNMNTFLPLVMILWSCKCKCTSVVGDFRTHAIICTDIRDGHNKSRNNVMSETIFSSGLRKFG